MWHLLNNLKSTLYAYTSLKIMINLRSVIIKISRFSQAMFLNSLNHQTHLSDSFAVKFTSTQEVIVWTILDLLVIPHKTLWNIILKITFFINKAICNILGARLCRVQQRAITANPRQRRVITSLRCFFTCL